MELNIKLAKIQRELKAPKGQMNNFGGYKYRSCEDILEAVKPMLGDIVLTVSDSIELIGDRIYVKATASLSDNANRLETTAYAREPLSKKGMDESQITGAASSYARKYALNGLFLIDENKDPDNTNKGEDDDKDSKKKPLKPKKTPPKKPEPKWITENKHKRLEILITKKLGRDKEKREGVREAIGQMREIHPADKEFEDIHLNKITEHEYKQITDKLSEREDV